MDNAELQELMDACEAGVILALRGEDGQAVIAACSKLISTAAVAVRPDGMSEVDAARYDVLVIVATIPIDEDAIDAAAYALVDALKARDDAEAGDQPVADLGAGMVELGEALKEAEVVFEICGVLSPFSKVGCVCRGGHSGHHQHGGVRWR